MRAVIFEYSSSLKELLITALDLSASMKLFISRALSDWS